MPVRKLKKLLLLAGSPGYWRALSRGVAASIELDRVPFIDALTVLDVGANRGQFVATLALQKMPSAHVHSFEPGPEAIAKLNLLYTKHPRVSIHPYALGAQREDLALHIPRENDHASFISGEGNPVEVEIRTLDELSLPIERPCVLKIDVQGYERQVLTGARETLTEVDQALIECTFLDTSATEIFETMLQAGFIVRGIYNARSYGNAVCEQADVLFERQRSR